jgi:single-stranded DNA-binding protein
MSGIEAAFFGVLGRDAEIKTSKAGRQYLRINVRVADNDAAQWVSVMVFEPEAIQAAAKLVKGARIYVEGRLSLDEWTAQDGTKKHSLSVLSFHTRLSAIGRNKLPRETGEDGRAPAPNSALPFDDEVPF